MTSKEDECMDFSGQLALVDRNLVIFPFITDETSPSRFNLWLSQKESLNSSACFCT